MEELKKFLDLKLFEGTDYQFPIINILYALVVLVITWIIVGFFIRVVLNRYYKRKGIEIGDQYAVNKIIKYFFYVVGIMLAMQALGIQLTVLWGGMAALVVGIGLGLQNTFNDFASGLILLFDRSIKVGDIIELDGLVGRVIRIGMRTSRVLSRTNVMIIVPNSKMVDEKVINWTDNDEVARFSVSVGVAYGSDTRLVEKLILGVVNSHPKVMKEPSPFVRFQNFGDSSLDFEVFFWSRELLPIDNVRSDIRFQIDQAFRDHGISIPFPQRDIWFRNPAKSD